ncbi:MAG: hypothetical protein JSV52_11845 [Candidatus Zixiibacteriota bacterium]|nr:MAG: hypothetical protein JSV52_11845 [candidate division Zixibacteria bacterium]
MITFHEIRRVIQKMAVLSSHVTRLNQLIPEVVRLSEKIDSLNKDLTLERDRITAKIRSVEVLGEILRTHVYQNQASAVSNPANQGFGAGTGNALDQQPSDFSSMADSGDPDTTAGGQSQSGLYPRLDGSSMML